MTSTGLRGIDCDGWRERSSLFLCVAAVLLYWPTLWSGFLSDDFVLLARASRWDIGPVTNVLFRPLPLLIWAALSAVRAPAFVFHLLNITLHATAAYLAARVVEVWIPGRHVGFLVWALALASPLAPEAVAWCSGIFDVLATCLVLGVVLVSRDYDTSPGRSRRSALFALGFAAVLTRETAVVVPALVAVDAWIRRRMPRQLRTDIVILFVIASTYAAVRVLAADSSSTPAWPTKYMVQRAVFLSFGSFAAPWHSDVLTQQPWLAEIHGFLVVTLLTLFFVTRGERQSLRAAIGAAVWILLPVVPVFSFFGVGQDLQGSRYLYMSTAGWAGLVGIATADCAAWNRRLRTAVWLGASMIVAASIVETRIHLRAWSEAAALRDVVEAAALRDLGDLQCGTVTVEDLPDSVRGAFVFRNGGSEVLSSLGVGAASGGATCIFRWDPISRSFIPPTALAN